MRNNFKSKYTFSRREGKGRERETEKNEVMKRSVITTINNVKMHAFQPVLQKNAKRKVEIPAVNAKAAAKYAPDYRVTIQRKCVTNMNCAYLLKYYCNIYNSNSRACPFTGSCFADSVCGVWFIKSDLHFRNSMHFFLL